jgi:hypothetical protein
VAFLNSVEIGFTLHSCTIRGVHFDISTYRVFFVWVCLYFCSSFLTSADFMLLIP